MRSSVIAKNPNRSKAILEAKTMEQKQKHLKFWQNIMTKKSLKVSKYLQNFLEIKEV